VEARPFGALYRYIPAARTANTPRRLTRPLYPKDRTLQEGFSLSACGGSAPIPDVPVGINTAQSVAVGIRIGHSGPFDIPE
jgi:hypothetical protein